MTFTYNQPWATGRDQVRFIISDRLAAHAHFSDEELDSLLAANGGDVRLAAADALDSWAAVITRTAIRWNVTGMGVDRTLIPMNMIRLAKQLRDQAQAEPYEFESVVDHAVTLYGEDRTNYPNTDAGEDPVP